MQFAYFTGLFLSNQEAPELFLGLSDLAIFLVIFAKQELQVGCPDGDLFPSGIAFRL